MIRQLRQKMVATAMISLFVVLTVILCAIHWVNYQVIVTSSDDVLDILGANRGMFPRPGLEGFSPEMTYEARYFSVLLTPQGQTILVDTGKLLRWTGKMRRSLHPRYGKARTAGALWESIGT